MDASPTVNVTNGSQHEHGGSGSATLNIEAKQVFAPVAIYNTKTYLTRDPEVVANKPKHEVRSCCETTDGDGNKRCDVFQTNLKTFHSKLAFPKVAWIKEGKKLLIDEHFIQLELNESKKQIKIQDVFCWEKDERPLRILIEGQPGFGKTTLAIKLAHDWATTGKYINFKFAFLVPLRDLGQRSFEAVIEEIGKRCDSRDIVSIINNHRRETLFLLDGLDELEPKERGKIMKMLYGHLYSEVTVVAFCQTGLFRLSGDERSELFGSHEMLEDFSDKRIYTMGITSTQKKRQFLEKLLLPKNTIEVVMKTLSSQLKLFNSPLLLMLLSIVIRGGETVDVGTTKTDLFKQIFNLILKQSLTKRGEKFDYDFDLFRLDLPLNNTQEEMKEFGNLTVRKIVENNFIFEGNGLTDAIYQHGFLSNREEITFDGRKNHYEVFHLSIIEFAAAFALWIEINTNKSAWTENNLKLVTNHFFKTSGTSLILPVLASLMESKLDSLLSVIDSYNVWFVYFKNFPFILLSECLPINIQNSKLLKNFILVTIPTYFYRKEKICREMLKYGINCGKIKSIEVDKETKLEMFADEIRTRLLIMFELNPKTKFIVLSKACQAREMFSSRIPFQGPLEECLRFAASPNCESCHLKFRSYVASSEFLQLIRKHEVFSKIKYHQLTITILTEIDRQLVIKLLRNNQVECLELIHLKSLRQEELDMTDFSISAAKSNRLQHLKLAGCTIDLYDLINGGSKKYHRLTLSEGTYTCRKPLLFPNCCYEVEITNLEGMVDMKPTVLNCSSLTAIYKMMQKYPSWTGFKTVKTLLVINPDLLFLNPFTNLQILGLVVSDRTDVEKLANCIQTLPIINLVIHNKISSWISKLFRRMNNLWANKEKSQLKTITLYETSGTYKYSDAHDLLLGLRSSYWDTVNFMGGERTDVDKLMQFVSNLNLFVKISPAESIYFELDPHFNHLNTYYNHNCLRIVRKSDDESWPCNVI